MENVYFIRNIPNKFDYIFIYSILQGYGNITEYKPVYDNNMTSIRFIFVKYRNKITDRKFQNRIIDFNILYQEQGDSIKERCMDLRSKLLKHRMKEYVDDNLYYTDKEAWKKRVSEIDKILKKF